jgi:hypothetical protein
MKENNGDRLANQAAQSRPLFILLKNHPPRRLSFHFFAAKSKHIAATGPQIIHKEVNGRVTTTQGLIGLKGAVLRAAPALITA